MPDAAGAADMVLLTGDCRRDGCAEEERCDFSCALDKGSPEMHKSVRKK
jgi:hypothetical protein